MVSFVVGGPAWDMEIREPLFRELVGLAAIEKCQPGIWVLHFVDRESATAAQWQLDLNGAHGITREEKQMRNWYEFVERCLESCPDKPEKMDLKTAAADLQNFAADGWEIPEGMTAQRYMEIWNEYVADRAEDEDEADD